MTTLSLLAITTFYHTSLFEEDLLPRFKVRSTQLYYVIIYHNNLFYFTGGLKALLFLKNSSMEYKLFPTFIKQVTGHDNRMGPTVS
jgi:hypothetical protein